MREPLATDMTTTDENVLIAGLRAMSPMVKLQHMVSLQKAALVVERLESSFLIRLPDVLDGLTHTRQFSATHLSTMFRIDFFARDSTPFAKMEFQRRQPIVIRENLPCTAWVATVEDTILSKLRWYQLGGGVSDRQWRDIQTMIRVNEDILDYTYLQPWGADLQLPHLLDAALRGERPRPTDDDSQQTHMF